MHPAFPLFILTAALVLFVADGLPVVRGNEDSFGWSMAAGLSSAMRRGRGRPRKFAAPSRAVTLTLPDRKTGKPKPRSAMYVVTTDPILRVDRQD